MVLRFVLIELRVMVLLDEVSDDRSSQVQKSRQETNTVRNIGAE